MSSEWLKVMLDEIERKSAAAELARIEAERREAEREAQRPEPQARGADASRDETAEQGEGAQGGAVHALAPTRDVNELP